MATWYSSFSGTSYMRMKVNAWESGVDFVNNQSIVNVEVILESLNGGYPFTYDSYPLSVWVGSVELFNGYRSYNVPSNGSVMIYNGSVTVPHESDGSKSLTVYADFQSAHGRATINQTLWLTTIQRASQIWVQRTSDNLNINTAEYGQTVRLYIEKAGPSFTSTIYCNWNGVTEGIQERYTGDAVNWTIPVGYMNRIPNASSSWGTIYCETYSGNTLIGTKTITLTTTVPASVIPTFTSVSASELNNLVTTALGNGNYVKGFSNTRFTINGASGVYGSEISQYKITFENYNYSSVQKTFDIAPSTSGTVIASAKVVDSRGRESIAKTVSIIVLDYSKPKITTLNVIRDEDVQSTLLIDRTGTFSNLSGLNTATMKLYTSPKGAEIWTLKNTTTSSNGSIGGLLNITGYLEENSFDIKLELYDEFTTSSPDMQLTVIGTAIVPFSMSDVGASVGKIYQEGGAILQVGDSATFDGTVDIAGDLTVVGTGGNVYHTGKKPTPSELGVARAFKIIEGYQGITLNDNTDFEWLRATQMGIIPYTSSGDSSSLGTSNWQWREIHGKNYYQDGSKLIDSGTVGEGSYLRFANGFQICWGYSYQSAMADVAHGSLWRDGNLKTITFPASFHSAPICSAIGDEAFLWLDSTTTTGASFMVIKSLYMNILYQFGIQWVAIGRWKE